MEDQYKWKVRIKARTLSEEALPNMQRFDIEPAVHSLENLNTRLHGLGAIILVPVQTMSADSADAAGVLMTAS